MKYKTSECLFNKNVIDNIIFNERSHLVINYKEFLISEDSYEFLKRYYSNEESIIRLKKFINYYSKYSFLFPNYSPLSEAVIIYKNINLKQKVIDDKQNDNKGNYIKNYNNNNEDEILDSKIFNSKVYDSIINNSENYLSIFSYDKESFYNENKDDEITELIKNFDKIDSNTKNNKKEKKQIKSNLNLDNIIYTRKKTPNHSINLKVINNSSANKLTKNLKSKNNDVENKTINKTKNELGNILVNNNGKQLAYKKINLLDFSAKKSNRSSGSFKIISRENSLITPVNTNKSTNKNSICMTSLKEYNNEQNQVINKVNDIPKKLNELPEKKALTPIKVNKKRLNNRKNKRTNKNNKNDINKDSKLKNSEKSIINTNRYNDYPYRQKINSYSFYNKNINLTERNINNKTKESENIKTIYNLRNSNNGIRNNKINRNKDKINIIKNRDEFAHQFNASIKINNNIKIIDSNCNKSNIIKNIYETSHFNQSDNISDFIHKTPYEKKIISENKSYNVLKKHKNNNILDSLLNNKNYFSSINDNKTKKFFSKEIFSSLDKRHTSVKATLKQHSSIFYHKLEVVSTPFNIRQNNKIFSKINIKINNNSLDKKNKTISNESIKNHKNIIKKKYKEIKDNRIKNFVLNNKFLNKTNISISTLTNENNHSFLTSKIESNNVIYQNFFKSKKEKNDNNYKKKIKKDKNYTFCLNSNNINETFMKKANKKLNNENIKEFNKEKKIKKIMTESNEQINQYKKQLVKKFNQMQKV